MPPRVVSVTPGPDYVLAVTFEDGLSGRVNCRSLIVGSNAGVFAGLREAEAFARAHVTHGAVTWPGELDLAPDAMYDAIKGRGEWVLE